MALLVFVVLVGYLTCLAALENDVLMEGDAVIAALFSLADAPCSVPSEKLLQPYEAVRWFFKELNNRGYITNVSLGLHAFKTCGQSSRAAKVTIDMFERWKTFPSIVFGLLGPGYSSEARVVSRLLSSLPVEYRLLQIVYSATAASLSDKTIFQNLFRVIPADNVQVDVILQMLRTLKWNYVAIDYGTEAANTIKAMAQKHGICIPLFESVDTNASTEEYILAFTEIGNKLYQQESPIHGLVFFGQATTAKDMLQYLTIKVNDFQIVVSESIGRNWHYVQNDLGDIYPRAKGLLRPGPPYYTVERFRRHWLGIHTNATIMKSALKDDSWLLTYLNQVTGCDLNELPYNQEACLQKSAKAAEKIQTSIYVNYVLMAAAAFAKTFRQLYEKTCPKRTGLCADMIALNSKKTAFSKEIENVRIDPEVDFPELEGFTYKFSFRNGELIFGGDGPNLDYAVDNLQMNGSEFSYVKVGGYVNGKLSIDTDKIKSYTITGEETYGAANVQCQQGMSCLSCKPRPDDGGVFHIPGDYYIVGLVPIHNKGKGDDPFHCGTLRKTGGVDIAEGIAYSVRKANKKTGIFASLMGNLTIGLILFDTCNSPYLAKERIRNLISGGSVITDVDRATVNNKIIGFVGPLGSSVSVPMSSLMTDLGKPYISYASTSSTLGNRKAFPTFMRTCSPDTGQSRAIMQLASMLRSKYVQLIITAEEYGLAANDSLHKAGKENRICIAQVLAIPDEREVSKFRGLVSDLRRFPKARVIIIFVRSHVTPVLMKALNEEMELEEFIFIGGESWGHRGIVLPGNRNLHHSLTLAQELPKNPGFEDYFSEVDPFNSEDPWMQDFLEEVANCSFPVSFNKKRPRQCSPSLTASKMVTDTWVPFAINAAYSLILGFSKTLLETCNICPKYTTKDLINNVKSVRMDIFNDGRRIRVYDDNGEGNVGYKIYQVVRGDTSLGYKQIGTSENLKQFKLSHLVPGSLERFTSSCPNEAECKACSEMFEDTDQIAISSEKVLKEFIIPLSVTTGVLAVVALLFCMLYLGNRRKNNRKVDDPYLTVVPEMEERSATESSNATCPEYTVK